MSDLIDFMERRNHRDIDPQHIGRDHVGRPMYEYVVSYRFDGSTLGDFNLWAYSAEDAELRVAAIRGTLVLDGQLCEVVPV